MSRRRLGAAAIAVLTSTTGLTIVAAGPASADPGPILAITSVGDLIVDGVHERVFISDPDSGRVIATDYSGNQLAAAQVNDANSLALAPDSSRLYVTSLRESAIFALDTTTLDQAAKYSTGAVAPGDVAIAGDRIWFSYTDGNPSELGTIDPSTEPPTVLLDRYRTGRRGAELATAAAKPNRIGVASDGKIAVLDVSGDTITEAAAVEGGGEVADMAISPDGEKIATVPPNSFGIVLRDVSNLQTEQRLQYEGFANAVDFAADGSIAGGSLAPQQAIVHIYAPSGELITELKPENRGVGRERGLAWEPNGDRLFGVSSNGNVFRFNAYANTKQSPTKLTFSAWPPTPVPAAPVTLTGTLTSSLSLPAGTAVALSRNGASLGDIPIGDNGSFSFVDTPPSDGTATYQVSYAGDATHLSASATTAVQVARAVSTVTLFGPTTALPGQSITIPGRLTSDGFPFLDNTVSVTRSGRPLGTFEANSNRDFSFTDTPPAEGTWTYEVSYAGTSTHLPTTTTTSVEVSRMASTLTLAGPTSATLAKPLTITGKLASPLALTAGSTVSISRIDLEHPTGIALGARTVAADGSFAVTDTPTAGGPVVYQVAFAGDYTHTPASTTKSVAVSRTTPALSLTNNGKTYAYGQTVSFTARLGTTYKSRTVEIWADPAGTDQGRRLVKRGTVSKTGYFTASLKLTRNTAVSVVFPGDSRTAPRTVVATVGTKVSLTLKLSRYYKTAKISGQTYRYYRTSGSAWFTTSMTGAANRHVYVQLQRYVKGKWQTWDSRYFDATDTMYVTGSGLTGTRLRVRTAYVKGSSGDSLNTSTWAPYQYFTFTK
ncbi:hypothetical protein [Actinoplanes sp. HUAS TT8]|uniref:hypothetical protein n=1 Tax=Actinoplanes sp. HUAS TT8 TaxID=3447453 RepID=UPI003F5260B3